MGVIMASVSASPDVGHQPPIAHAVRPLCEVRDMGDAIAPGDAALRTLRVL